MTREIIELLRAEVDETAFGVAVRERLADEAQHCGYFMRLLKHYWASLDKADRDALGDQLAPFIKAYLSTGTEEAFAHQLLQATGFPREETKQIVAEVYGGYELGAWHPKLLSIINLLTGSEILAHRTIQQRFFEAGWIKD